MGQSCAQTSILCPRGPAQHEGASYSWPQAAPYFTHTCHTQAVVFSTCPGGKRVLDTGPPSQFSPTCYTVLHPKGRVKTYTLSGSSNSEPHWPLPSEGNPAEVSRAAWALLTLQSHRTWRRLTGSLLETTCCSFLARPFPPFLPDPHPVSRPWNTSVSYHTMSPLTRKSQLLALVSSSLLL